MDGVKINPADASGNKVEPFTYEGTIYIPLRAVAEALGKEVTWDQKTYTAYIGKAQKDVVGINELTLWFVSDMGSVVSGYLGAGWSENANQFIMSQKNYTTQHSLSVMFDSWDYPRKIYGAHYHKDGSTWMCSFDLIWRTNSQDRQNDYHFSGASTKPSYKLNKGYCKLTGTFGIDDLSDSGLSAILTIKGADEKELYSSSSISKGSTPIAVDVDILDQEQIVIKFETSTQEGLQSPETLYAEFTDVKLHTVGK